MKRRNKYILTGFLALLTGMSYELEADLTAISSQFPDMEVVQDTVPVKFPVAPTVPSTYEDLQTVYPVDLRHPVDFDRNFEYNPLTNRYELRSQIGGTDITTPISLTREEYLRYSLEKSMNAYFKSRNDEEFTGEGDRKKDALAGFGFNFDLGPADKIFGPGGVRLQPQGSITTKIGVTHTISGDPTLTERQRNRWAFDFDPQIQASVLASIGDKMNFDLNYNTQSTFDYDAKKLKLAYAGKEDEILKVLEAGNVSMNTTNSLIRGGAALFGIKTQLQFGKLTVDALFSQQNSQSRSTSSRGSVQTVPFEITVDNYDENMHFFVGHYFPDIYDEAMSKLPYIQSGILIDNIEIWVTNKRSNYDQARNIVAFADLGEYHHISNSALVRPEAGKEPLPDNRANTLYGNIVNNFPGARDISQVNQALLAGGFTGGQDYEKIENARKLETSEYTLNTQLGYIHLRMPLQPDEALAVAYSYKYRGESYQVGEFSNDNPGRTSDNLYLKLIKGTSQSPAAPGWPLMMKNVYTINQRGIEKDRFRLDIKYQSDTTGIYLNYITEGAIANQLLLRVENLDRLDSRNEPHADGFFDYVENFTILPSEGKIIFPVVEPFGKHLRKKIVEGAADPVAANAIADKYVYQELYDTTLTIARQTAEKNKFILAGEYKGSGGNSIALDGMNIARGSVAVTANGIRLKENQDYTVNYATGEVTIINPAYADANIQTSSENQSTFGMQRKTMMGVNLNYAFSPQFNLGATLMNLSEMPMTLKTGPGEESINNTLFGFNTNYTTRSQWLTNLVDKLPLVDLTEPSQISLNAEYAQLIPGHYRSKWGGDYSYIEDFERAKMTIDLRSPYWWFLSATPSDNHLFPESRLVNNVDYGKNRALLAWYYIDGLFTRKSSLTPTHIKNDEDQLSNHYVREIREEELFPNKDIRFDEASTIPVLNLAFYPKERGPYNLDALGMNPDGSLSSPEKRWGGIFRKIDSGQTDFEANNIEHIEFWMLDPFIYEPGAQGGDLYFNLGDLSEDILKDEKKFFENGLPVDGDKSKVEETVWGYIPRQQSQVYAFDPQGRPLQDVGLNGLSTEQEFEYPAYHDYLQTLENHLPPETVEWMRQDPFSPFRDPSGDNYHYFRGSDYDREERSILSRYKHYNGTEGNSANADDTNENYNTAARISPDVEDINQDNTLNENEKYFRYRVSIRPQDMQVGRNFIVDKRITRPKLKNGKTEEVTWYQFKIPIREYEDIEGNIRDFQSIRFIRMFLTHFSDSVILRFGTLELVRGDWRAYTKDLSNPNLPPSGDASISISTVNIEENGDKKPVNYIMPPGVNRMTDPGQTQLIQENEQSLAIKINHLSTGDARAVYKNERLDTRQYKRFQLFVHAEKTEDSPETLADNELSVFLRLGSDYKNNYYEYEIPLKMTAPGTYNGSINSDRETVWPRGNMFDFPFELLTNLKLQRNREKRQEGSGVTYTTPYSAYDPNKPMNKVTVMGNPSLSEVKVIMIGVRNNSRYPQSAEIWLDEMRLTEFNEDGGWAGNANLYVALSDLGSVNFAGRKETAGFGSLDQGIMDRNLDDKQSVNVTAQIEMGKFFPEKAKVSLPVYYSYRQETISPKYNPLDQDILLKDALAAVETQAEKDSIRNFSVDKVVSRSFDINTVRANIVSKTPMPYDPANFTISYSSNENYIQNATTEYDRQTDQRLLLGYLYAPPFKPWKPFASSNSNSNQNKTDRNAPGNASPTKKPNPLLSEFEWGYLPKSIAFNSDITRNYFELQLRDLGNPGENMLPASFREDFYWNRTLAINWDLTKNLRLNLNTGTDARIDAPYVQVNKKQNLSDYELWKDSVLTSIRNWGTPVKYDQQFSAVYELPFRHIPLLNFISGNLGYNAHYDWTRGAVLEDASIELGHIITNERTLEISNIAFNLLNLYNKNSFLKAANDRFTMKPSSAVGRNTTRRSAAQQASEEQRKKAANEQKKKRFESEVQLNPDSVTTVKHSLNNKRIRVTARGADGRMYAISYKAVDNNTIRIHNKDSAKLHLSIAQLPPLDDLWWYKVAQAAARGGMMIRNVSFSYSQTQGAMIPGFRPVIGDFLGQGKTTAGNAPGWDFAFGLTDEDYLDRAFANGWLVTDNPNITTPAMFDIIDNFNMTAVIEPFAGMKIDLSAYRQSMSQNQVDFMYAGMPKRFTGNFKMTTLAIRSAFETSNAANGYASDAFDNFLNNRETIALRLEKQYGDRGVPGTVERNSADVLIPSFIAAYTGKDARRAGLDFFPSLLNLLPNWNIKYDGLMRIPWMGKRFKSFVLEHKYTCSYAIGSYTSYSSWTEVDDGIGYLRSMTTNQLMPSSPYNVMAANIIEAFDPLFGVNSVFVNNMNVKASYRTSRNINLNIASYQIVEMTEKSITAGLGYRIDHFNKIIHFPKKDNPTFNHYLTVSADISYRMNQSLNRKIQDGFTQPTTGHSQTTIQLTADYTLSRMIGLQAFYDRQISRPLVSSTAFPMSKSSFGVSLKVNLLQ
ncbi:MAG: cell surface protein SprA [Dysgonamonadaceae bacterium]|jgi:cell surface protein SprA|nr:cell surface protein SprA [Dysgonamonadaceae bacterium]